MLARHFLAAAILVLTGCAQVPKESVELASTVGSDITSIQTSHVALIKLYFDDKEAQVSQRPIAVHALEHLGAMDRGVTLVRKLLREGIRALQRGEDPRRAVARDGKAIRTFCRNTVLRIPAADTPEADRELVRNTGRKVAAAVIAGQAVWTAKDSRDG